MPDVDLVVVGAELLRDEVGVLVLVALLPARRREADAEGRQAALAGLGEQRDDEARVEAAGEQHPDRHVGDHPPLDGAAQRVEDLLLPLPRGRRRPLGRVDGGSQYGTSVLRPSGSIVRTVAGGSLRTPGEDRPRRRDDRVPGHVVVQRDRVDRRCRRRRPRAAPAASRRTGSGPGVSAR